MHYASDTILILALNIHRLQYLAEQPLRLFIRSQTKS